jgi:diacylglycerol O-acyltransferase / wax synthase
VTTASGLIALVPMSVTEDDGVPTSLGSQVAPHLQALPIGEPNALMRLHQVAYGTQAHKDTGRSVGARTLSDIAGFAPTTLHALGVRVSSDVMRKQHDIVITNVPGPQVPLFAAGQRLVASYPVLPLEPGHLLAIGVTSYNGEVFVGLTGDRDAFSDLDVLGGCLRDAVDELRETTVRAGGFRQPTRKASASAKRAAAKKAAARQEAVRRASGQRRAAVRNLANRAVELRDAAQKATQLPPAKKTPAPKKASTKSGTAEDTTTGKASAEKTTAKKTAAKQSATPTKAAAKKTAAKKSPGAKTDRAG